MTSPRLMLVAALAASTSSYGHVYAKALARLQPSGALAEILHQGATIEKSGALGDRHRYEVSLTAGDFLEVSVSQDWLVVGLSLFSADGVLIRKLNVPDIHPLPQPLLFVSPSSARYLVEVQVEPGEAQVRSERAAASRRRQAEPSKYSLHVIALRPATSEDQTRAAWCEVLERAVKLERLGTLDGLRQAIAVYREAAGGFRASGDAALETAALEALASMTGFFAQFSAESAAARERLTDLYARMSDREQEVINLRNLAEKYYEGGRFEDARRAVGRAFQLAVAHDLPVNAAGSQRALGRYEFELGNYDRARELAQEAQERAARIPDPSLEALVIWDLSRLDELAGDLEAAVARCRRGLELARVASASVPRDLITMWLGFLHLRRGELDEAAARFEARLKMARQTVQRDQEALTRVGLGDVHLARGDRDAARQRYEAAAAALEKGFANWRCIAEQRVARMDLEDGRLDQAKARFETMLDIAVQRQNPPCEAEARGGLADLAAQRGDLEIAEDEARRVVALTEAFREAAISVESRSLGFGALAPAYERAIDISMRRASAGDDDAGARALTLNEQALARGLLDRVFEARLQARARVPPDLASGRREARERWRAHLAELQAAMRIRPNAPETKALIDETSALAVRVRDLESRVDAVDPRHASFLRPRPLDVKEIQALLDDDTLLLEYALGDVRSYLWVVSTRGVRMFTLPPRASIETLARRVHERLAQSPAAAMVSDRESKAAEEDRRALARLVIEPVASLLADNRLVVVLPGALSLIPFGALPQPGADPHAPPMIVRHEIIQVPSASILGTMRALMDGRARPRETAVIFADPIFDAQDPRLRPASSSARRERVPPLSALRLPELTLARLPFSRDEAEAIRSLAPESVATYLGLEATRERALGRALFDYRFIHFATHGVVNQELPSLSSLILSLVDRGGRPRDGLVMLPDIYDMTLNADVVVLSGCQTALGKHVRGEGPIGLARAFMYAGVPRVVASLWPVDDLATAQLMKRFYRGMLVDGLTPAAALRAAQRDLAKGRRWAAPYFWAPFVLQGDWR